MLENDSGADFLPMRLVAVLVIASLVLVSAAEYSLEIAGQLSKAAAHSCAARIVAIAASEYVEGCPDLGDGARVDVSIPGSVRTMTFGAIPADGLAESLACAYYIRYADDSDELQLTGFQIGSGDHSPGRGEPVVLYPGRYSIRIRTEEVNGSPMALMYVEDV